MPEYYTFTREDDADGIFYSFINSINIYSALFTIELYQNYLNNFPALLTCGYEFSFFSRKYNNQKRSIEDPLVRGTLYKIIEAHFEENGIETILLYRCDTSQDRDASRQKLFDKWYNAEDCYLKEFLFKESLQVEVRNENGSKKSYYIGYIAHNQNPNLKDVRLEFDSFCYQLASFEKE